jgi:hypothetical protein
MPKILINEYDYTNPGTPDGYSNYSVLIPGFMGRAPLETDNIQPDYNGVYEFTSVQDFLDTIGVVAPHDEVNRPGIVHYGNQMAYELLKQGYSVIYLPLEPETCVTKLTDAKTWEIFKDKANYDFRFVCHGLLESSSTSHKDSLLNTLQLLHNRGVIELNTDNGIALIDKNGSTTFCDIDSGLTNQDLEKVYHSEEAYRDLLVELSVKTDKPGDAEYLDDANLVDDSGAPYYTTGLEAIEAILTMYQEEVKNNISTDVIFAANANIANLAKYVADVPSTELPGRGDCVALIELDENIYKNSGVKPENAIIAGINSMADQDSVFAIDKYNGKYCALTVPSVVYNMGNSHVKVNGELKRDAFAGNKKFPGAFHYLACFMNSLQSGFKEWYAAAGYTRGTSAYKVAHTTVPLGEIAINALEPRNRRDENSPMFACNVIANFRGSYYLWGNRTAHPLGDANNKEENNLVASHFLNIRQLCSTVKKQLYVSCRKFTFDPNSDTLWFNFVNAIRPTLDAMKADQGIRDYKILKAATNEKATLKAKIRIIPIEAVEDFDLEVYLEDSFGEVSVAIPE